MENNKKRERREFVITDDEGMFLGDLSMISIVSDPAIQMSYQLFSKIEPKEKTEKFKVASEERMEITGPAMVPNMDIVRIDETTGEYFDCYFTETTIRACRDIYLENCNHIRANFEHATGPITGIFVAETWIVEDPENDKSNALGFKNIPKGTWFVTYKVKDPAIWEMIKDSEFTGFSIEGQFAQKFSSTYSVFEIVAIEKAIDEIVNENPNINVKSKYTLIYNLIKDIMFTEGMDEESKYRIVRKLLNKI